MDEVDDEVMRKRRMNLMLQQLKDCEPDFPTDELLNQNCARCAAPLRRLCRPAVPAVKAYKALEACEAFEACKALKACNALDACKDLKAC